MNDTLTPTNDEWIVTDNENYIEIASIKTCDSIASVHGGKTIGDQYDLAGRIARVPQLERELTVAREELKETKKHLKDANRGAEINAHALRINADKLISVTEQRDEYKAALQSADNHNHEIGTKLEIVTEQRDRLAATIERLKELPDTWRNECQGNWLRGGVVLQLAEDFDAAVKGGSDEIPR